MKERINLDVKPRTKKTGYITKSNSRESKLKYFSFHSLEANLIKALICMIIIALVFIIKKVDLPICRNITQNMNKAVSYQIQWDDIFKSDIISSFEDKVTSLFNKNTPVFNSDEENMKFISPINGEIVSYYEEKTHPIFKTRIEPRGIEIRITQNEVVNAIYQGKVTKIFNSTYQGSRVIIQHNKLVKSVYDGIEECYVEVGQELTKGEEIGLISADNNNETLMFFEIWSDNKAVDPLQYVEIHKNNEE